MTKMTPLLERNEQFAAAYSPGPLGPPVLRMTTASPSRSPRVAAGSTRWSRQETMTTCEVGGPSGTGV